ncbi:signal peptidase I [Bianquea renquensis]|uniref:Signal peptidase I n=1 Tax=Bianquea renquensis TaxID=2763661 RepID=A0A926I373_9FIRM|nr:signal peptidase I [Bianquea renquensis]MBC8545223.1 signal peptidase I [Bianquea renquensis]
MEQAQKDTTMREAQEERINEKASPPREDPRIDVLIGAYRNLGFKVDLLQEQVQEQEKELNRQKGIVEAILAEEQRRRDAGGEGHAAPAPTSPYAQVEKSVGEYQAEEKRSGEASGGSRRQTKSLGGRAWKIIGEVVFYGLLLLLIVAALFIRTTGSGAPKSLAGYSGMIVLTESMQSEIPKGSLVIAKQVDPNTLQIGDDITYMANQTTSVTHRIVGIMENYENTGQRAFEAQGVMNSEPDRQPVPAVNVVGKVVYHSEVLGNIASFIRTYWPVLLFVLAVGAVLLHVLRRIFRNPPKEAGSHGAAD